MFDLEGQGGTLAINGRPAGRLGAWRLGPGASKTMRVRADVTLAPLYRRLGITPGSAATVVLNPRAGALRPAYLTIEGTVTEYANGQITISDARQTRAEAVSEPGRAAEARDVIRARRIH